MDARARITLPDVLFVLMSLAYLGALYPVFREGLETRAHLMTTGELYLFQMILPLGILVLFTVIYVKAAGGMPR
jgi:hypothetical protein